MAAERERKLNLSDPGRDAAGDELELIIRDADIQDVAAAEPAEDAGFDSFLERLPFAALLRGRKD